MGAIWLVSGISGQYSDYRKWSVAVFSAKARAEAWKDGANAYVEKFMKRHSAYWERSDDPDYDPEMKKIPRPKNPFDKRMDDSGTEYHVEEIPLDPPPPRKANPHLR